MPVTDERPGETSRRRERAWLVFGLVILALLLAVVVTPIVHPVSLQLGDTVVAAETASLYPNDGINPQGFSARNQRVTGPLGNAWGDRFKAYGVIHTGLLRVHNWGYGIAWFKGRRLK
jgi:hypothetical protein